jgi:hypothetical protein
MPYSDPVKRKENHSKWLREQVAKGYGKWLYAKRRVLFTDAERFRETLLEILNEAKTIEAAQLLASKVLKESDKEHKALGTWRERSVHDAVSAERSRSK